MSKTPPEGIAGCDFAGLPTKDKKDAKNKFMLSIVFVSIFGLIFVFGLIGIIIYYQSPTDTWYTPYLTWNPTSFLGLHVFFMIAGIAFLSAFTFYSLRLGRCYKNIPAPVVM